MTSIKRKVYSFYGVIIGICLLSLLVFPFNIYAKIILCTMILLCLAIMRGVKNAAVLPMEDNAMTKETPEATEPESDCNSSADCSKTIGDKTTVIAGDPVDVYLRLLIEADAELSSNPQVDKDSPSYNLLLNTRIAEKLTDRKHSKDNDSNVTL